MKTVFYGLPGNEKMTQLICESCKGETGKLEYRKFPDGESYLCIHDSLEGKNVCIVCSLFNPDEKIFPLYMVSRLVRDLGATRSCLIAPYLPYMRQDKAFKEGEAVSARYFAELISRSFDALVTVDPHLHRIHDLDEIYTITSKAVHSAGLIADYIRRNVQLPVIIGPDSESEQWVSEIALQSDAPYFILEKTRHGDRNISLKLPEVRPFLDKQPVLVDDIISTATTMIETCRLLRHSGMRAPVCIAVHPLFAENAYDNLKQAGAIDIVSCNTIIHNSKQIDISTLFQDFVNDFC